MTALPAIDHELIRNLIAWAEADVALDIAAKADPRFAGWGRWDQGEWAKVRPDSEGGACGTAFCMAGQAVTQAGYRLDYSEQSLNAVDTDDPEDYLSVAECIPRAPVGVDDKGNVKWEDVGEAVNIEETGKEVLGLTDYEADVFFGANNGITTLKGMANLFFAARGLPIPYDSNTVNSLYSLDTPDGREYAEGFYENTYETHFPWEKVAQPF